MRRLILCALIVALHSTSARATPLFFHDTFAIQGSQDVLLFPNPGVTLLAEDPFGGTDFAVFFLIGIRGTTRGDTIDALFTFDDGFVVHVQRTISPGTYGEVTPIFFNLTLRFPQPYYDPIGVRMRIDLLNSNPDFIVPTT